ncbi:MAG: hypothetical protein V4699_00265 [Patescibacteria group bacterium]
MKHLGSPFNVPKNDKKQKKAKESKKSCRRDWGAFIERVALHAKAPR